MKLALLAVFLTLPVLAQAQEAPRPGPKPRPSAAMPEKAPDAPECLGQKGVTCEALARIQAEYIAQLLEARNRAEGQLAELRAAMKAQQERKPVEPEAEKK